MTEWKVGEMAEKTAGDYYFRGTVVSVFTKKSGAVRLVVENADGILHIFNPNMIHKLQE